MIFEQSRIAGVWKIGLQPHEDDRGFFARTFCAEEFAAHGLPGIFEQSSLSRNPRAGTLRGMHFQIHPFDEAKLVRCVRGAIYDVAIDLREGSPTRGKWVSFELTAENGLGVFLPPGLAHGFQTLKDDSDVLYQIMPAYRPGFGAGVRWNDPAFAVKWPLADPIIATRDASFENWRP